MRRARSQAREIREQNAGRRLTPDAFAARSLSTERALGADRHNRRARSATLGAELLWFPGPHGSFVAGEYTVRLEDEGWTAYCATVWMGCCRLSRVAKGHCEEDHRRRLESDRIREQHRRT